MSEAVARWWQASSPVGPLLLVARGQAITQLHFQSGTGPGEPPAGAQRSHVPFADLLGQLEEYFAGERHAFKLELAPEGTAFQHDVWDAISAIGYGQTLSYAQVAAGLGRPQALRAVGQACGANPLPIIVPCHRVLASHQRIGGFTGGLGIKQRLLALEQAARPFRLA